MKTLEQQLQEIETKRNELLRQLEAKKSEGMEYVIVRTYSAGVFAGFLSRREGKSPETDEWYIRTVEIKEEKNNGD